MPDRHTRGRRSSVSHAAIAQLPHRPRGTRRACARTVLQLAALFVAHSGSTAAARSQASFSASSEDRLAWCRGPSRHKPRISALLPTSAGRAVTNCYVLCRGGVAGHPVLSFRSSVSVIGPRPAHRRGWPACPRRGPSGFADRGSRHPVPRVGAACRSTGPGRV